MHACTALARSLVHIRSLKSFVVFASLAPGSWQPDSGAGDCQRLRTGLNTHKSYNGIQFLSVTTTVSEVWE